MLRGWDARRSFLVPGTYLWEVLFDLCLLFELSHITGELGAKNTVKTAFSAALCLHLSQQRKPEKGFISMESRGFDSWHWQLFRYGVQQRNRPNIYHMQRNKAFFSCTGDKRNPDLCGAEPLKASTGKPLLLFRAVVTSSMVPRGHAKPCPHWPASQDKEEVFIREQSSVLFEVGHYMRK